MEKEWPSGKAYDIIIILSNIDEFESVFDLIILCYIEELLKDFKK